MYKHYAVIYSSVSAVDLLQMMVLNPQESISAILKNHNFWDQAPIPKIEHLSDEVVTFNSEAQAKTFIENLPDSVMAICREMTETHVY